MRFLRHRHPQEVTWRNISMAESSAGKGGPVLEAMYRFLLWLIPAVEKFPRAQKFLLGDSLGLIPQPISFHGSPMLCGLKQIDFGALRRYVIEPWRRAAACKCVLVPLQCRYLLGAMQYDKGRVEDRLSPALPHQTVHAVCPHTAFRCSSRRGMRICPSYVC